ncbi:Signal peptide-domain containing protein [Planctomycetales bacterium 10988]|nr:Signal peptide-domain containing protein [Planctomycetales bacterium 10988]
MWHSKLPSMNKWLLGIGISVFPFVQELVPASEFGYDYMTPAPSMDICPDGMCGEEMSYGCDPCNVGCEPEGCGLGLFSGLPSLGDIVAPSDKCFNDFVSPMTNPVYFEDPRSLTEVRFIFINQKIPGDNILQGGNFQVYAAQIRVALNERLSIIAVKDGIVDLNSQLLPDEEGFANVTAGLKYTLYRDPCQQRLLAVGAHYEIPIGSRDVFQGDGDGLFTVFTSGGFEFAEYGHVLAAGGIRIPANRTDNSQMSFVSAHVDYEVFEGILPFIEANWLHYIRGGAGDQLGGATDGFEGHDIITFGSTGVTNDAENGQDIVTLAAGTKLRLTENSELGFAWEFPVTSNKGPNNERNRILNDRLTVDLIIRY